jgi:hypothetical protein
MLGRWLNCLRLIGVVVETLRYQRYRSPIMDTSPWCHLVRDLLQLLLAHSKTLWYLFRGHCLYRMVLVLVRLLRMLGPQAQRSNWCRVVEELRLIKETVINEIYAWVVHVGMGPISTATILALLTIEQVGRWKGVSLGALARTNATQLVYLHHNGLQIHFSRWVLGSCNHRLRALPSLIDALLDTK